MAGRGKESTGWGATVFYMGTWNIRLSLADGWLFILLLFIVFLRTEGLGAKMEDRPKMDSG